MDTSERRFENEIEYSLTHLGASEFDLYESRNPSGYDKQLGLYPQDLLDFVRETQPQEWARLERIHGSKASEKFCKRVAHELGVPWQLKPVARALLGIDPVEVDNRGEAIAALNERELRRYLRSDIEITLALSKRLAAAGELTRPQTTADR